MQVVRMSKEKMSRCELSEYQYLAY